MTMGFSLKSIIGDVTGFVKSVAEQIGDEVNRLPSNIRSIGEKLARETKAGIRFISPMTGLLVKAFSIGEKFILSPVGKILDKTLVKWDILPPNMMDAIINISAVPKRFITTGEFDRSELSKALRGATALAVAPSYGGIKRTSSYLASGKENFGLIRTLDKYSGGILTATEQVENFAEKVGEQKTLKTMDWVTGGVSALKVVSAITTGGGSVVGSFVTTGLTEKTNLADSSGGRALIMGVAIAASTGTASAAGVIPPVNTQQLFAKTIGDAVQAGAQQGTSKYLIKHTFLKEHKSGQILALSLGQTVGKIAGGLAAGTVNSIAEFEWNIFDSDDSLPTQAMAKEIAIKTAENTAAYEVAEELQKKGLNVTGEDLSTLSEKIRKSDDKTSWNQRIQKEIQNFVQNKLINELENLAAKELNEAAQKAFIAKIMAQLDRLILKLYDEAFDLINKYGIQMLIHLMRKYGLMSDYKQVVVPEDYMEFQITVNKINQENGRLFQYNNYVNPSPLPYIGVGLLAILGATFMVV